MIVLRVLGLLLCIVLGASVALYAFLTVLVLLI